MIRRLLLLSLSLMLSGCLVGPNYSPPIEHLPDSFSEDRPDETSIEADEDLAHWWTFFNDPFLNDLLSESLQGNFDLQIALEQVCQARSAFWVTVTAILPEVDSDVEIVRSRTSQTLLSNSFLNIPPIQNFYQAGLDVVWQIDIFGGLRRAARSAYNTWEATAEAARAVRTMVLSEVAMTYTNICALQQATDIALQIVNVDEDLLSLSLARFEAGLTNEQEVESSIVTLEVDRAALLVFQTNIRQAIYSLSILLGRPPETLLEQFASNRPIPSASGRIPLGLPSELLRRRPDIRSAERQIAAATEQIGVAVANLFPQVSLTGSSASFSSNPLQGANIGYASNSWSKWFTAPSLIWGAGVLITMPIFDFGKRLALINEQVSLEHQAFYAYQKTVISALEEVESDLVAYFNEEQRLKVLVSDTDANRRIYALNADLYQAGLVSFDVVLSAQENLLAALTLLTASQQALTIDLIALYNALGGGWECSYTP